MSQPCVNFIMRIVKRLNDQDDIVTTSECPPPGLEHCLYPFAWETRRDMEETEGSVIHIFCRFGWGIEPMVAAIANNECGHIQPVINQYFPNMFRSTQHSVKFPVKFIDPWLWKARFFPGITVKEFYFGIHFGNPRWIDISAKNIYLFVTLASTAFIIKCQEIAIFRLCHKRGIRRKITRSFSGVQ